MTRWVSEAAIIRLIGPKYYDGHCISCHEDRDDGYPMSELDLGKDRYAEVCCSVFNAFKAWQQEKGNKK